MKAYLCNRIHADDQPFMAQLCAMVAQVDIHPTSSRPDHEVLCRLVSQYDIILCGYYEKFDKHVARHSTRLKILASLSTGLDHIDLSSFKAKGVTVLHIPHCNAVSVAEHTWAMIFSLVKQIGPAHRAVLAGTGRRGMPDRPGEIRGKTLGIVGAGPTALHIAKIGHALGCRLLLWTLHPEKHQEFADYAAVFVPSLESLIEQSAIISVNIALSQQTHGLIKKKHFSSSSPGKILINTSRKEIIEPAVWTLNMAGKGLDVFDTDMPFILAGNVLFSPHIAGLTLEAVLRMKHEILRQIQEQIRGVPKR